MTTTLRELEELNQAQRWDALFVAAAKASDELPKRAMTFGYAAHALRQLKRLEEGFSWAQRGLEVDDEDLFVLNRASLLANLTQRYTVAWDLATQNTARRPTADGDRFNLAILLVNGLHAAAQLRRINEAVMRFTPVIEALDHPQLHFNAACLYALANDARALTYMRKALHHGKSKADFADSDFDALRDDAGFVAALERDWERERAALERANTADRATLRAEHFVDPSRFATHVPGDDERSPELEAAMLAAPQSLQHRVVYADWLEERGHPRADFMRASLACHHAASEDERMLAYLRWADLLEADASRLVGPLLGEWRNTRVEWKLGFVDVLWLPATWLLPDLAAHPSYRLLRSLSVEGPFDLPAIARDFPGLKVLGLVDGTLDVRELDLHFPSLTRLRLTGDVLQVGRLALPQLELLSVRTAALSASHLASIAQLRNLQVLSLSETGGSDAAPSDFEPLLRLPRLRHLILSVMHVDVLCMQLTQSPAAPQLETLDLSWSSLTDAGADVLRRHADRFTSLRGLNVSDTQLSAQTVEQLALAFGERMFTRT